MIGKIKKIENWIDVNDRLPEPMKKVLFLDTSLAYPDNCYTGVYYGKGTFRRSGNYNIANGVTHWMPLPKPPVI